MKTKFLNWINKEWEKDLTIWWAFVINVILLNISIGLHPVSETGDDDVMMAMVSGCFGEPTAHIIFVNICWAAVIRLLVLLVPQVNWYFILQYVLVFVAFFTVSYVILKLFGKRKGMLLSLLILLPYAYEGYVSFQFTKTAGILTAAGCFYLFYCMREKRRAFSGICGLLLVWLGSCYRFAMSAAVVAVCIGSISCSFFIDRIIQKRKISFSDLKQKKILLAVALLMGMVGIRCIDHIAYDSERWRDYNEFNYYRGCVRDFPIHEYEGNEEAYADIGITKIEYENLLNWNIADPDVYTTDKLKEIALLENKDKAMATVSNVTISGYFHFLTDSFGKNKMIYLYVILSFLLFLFVAQKKRFCLDIFVNFLAVLGICTFFYLRGRYGINRVDVCIWLASALMLLFGGSGRNLQGIGNGNVKREFLWKFCGCICFYIVSVWLTVMPVKNHLEMWSTEMKVQADYKEVLKYIDADEKGIYFMDACAAHYGYGIPWYESYPQEYCKNVVYLGGWYTNSPVTLKQWERNGIENPFRDICQMENTYIVDKYQHIDTTISYLREHYDKNVKKTLVYAVGDYKIYQILKKGEQNAE